MSIELIIRGGECVSHRGIEKLDIAVRDGIIVALGDLSDVTADEELDATGLYIMPGIIDTEYYLRQDLDSDTRAAVRGGITTILAHSDSPEQLENRLYCDYGFFIQANQDNINDLTEMEKSGSCAGIHINMIKNGEFEAITNDSDILNILRSAKRRVTVHAADQSLLDRNEHFKENADVASHPEWFDEKVSLEGLRRILAIARGAGRTVHIEHISSAAEMALLAAYKDVATAGLIPQYLLLSAPDCYQHFHNYVKMDPPIRDEANRLGLWKGLTSGIIDVLSSGHHPCPVEEKERKYPDCPSGSPAGQTMLPLMLDQVSRRSLSLMTLADLTSAGPARAFNIASKGRIAVGYDADFAIIDVNSHWVLDDDNVESICGWDLYAGAEFTGQVTGTVIRGRKVMWQDEILSDPSGTPVKYTDNMEEYPQES